MTEDNKITDSENLDLTLKYDEGMYQYIRLYKRVVELKTLIFFAIILFLFAYIYSQAYMKARLTNPDYWNLPIYWTLDGVFYIFSSIF